MLKYITYNFFENKLVMIYFKLNITNFDKFVFPDPSNELGLTPHSSHYYSTKEKEPNPMELRILAGYLIIGLTLSFTLPVISEPAGTCAASDYNTCDDIVPVRKEVYDEGKIIDISHRIQPDMPSWGSEHGIGQVIWLPNSMKNGSLANNSEMKLPTHTGTHVDAPGHVFDHYFDAGFDVDTLDLAILNGNVLLFHSFVCGFIIYTAVVLYVLVS